MSKDPSRHTWSFFRAGGFDQVKLETGSDLANLDQLDQKLWVALACPTTGIEFDPKTSALIDTDKDGRIRAPELIAAIKWAGSMLKNPDALVKGGDSIELSAFDDATPDGKQLLASARQVLANLGRKDATAISLADASDANQIFANTVFNGDGVIITDSAEGDAATKSVINDIAGCFGTVNDRSGKPGIDQAKSDAFFAQATAYETWVKASEAAGILPAGDGTAAASAAVQAIKPKVDDYFGRCRLAAYDPRTLVVLNRSEAEIAANSAKDLSINAREFASFPLAPIAAGKPLPLNTGINPAHAAEIATLQSAAIKPLLGERSELTEADWAGLQSRLAPFENWKAAKAGEAVEKLGIHRVREILAAKSQEKINALLAKDLALAPEAASIASVEKLVRYVRDLHVLSLNFVSFKNLYEGAVPAIFQCGTLYLDQRSCNLCLAVEDAAQHALMAGLAGACLVYCDCTRKGTGEKMSIVAIVSQGDDDNLMVGRNGLFYDRKGKDYDATITKILSNPISVRQAFWSPYKKFARLIEEQVTKRAAAADSAANDKLQAAAEAAAKADAAVPAAAAAAPAPAPKIDVGTIAAMGVAFGAIGGFLTAVAAGLLKISTYGLWAIVGVVVAVILLISGPAMLLAFIKLRKRNLGPILDANGWAVNARAKINVPFGTSLTGIATIPPGSHRDLVDPFAEKKSVWPRLIITLVVLALIVSTAYSILNNLGYIYEWSDGRMGIEHVSKSKATVPNPPASALSTLVPAKTAADTNAPLK